jgi:hypothetical protein
VISIVVNAWTQFLTCVGVVGDVLCLYVHCWCGPVSIVSSAVGSISFHLVRKPETCVMMLVT